MLSAPTKIACATPAAMNSDIPDPIPCFCTTSSKYSSSSDPATSCKATITCVMNTLPKSGIDVDNNEEVPNTFDNVLMSIGLGVVGVIVLTLTILAIRKKNNK